MPDLQQLIATDKELLLSMNGSDSLFCDGMWWVISDTKTWLLMGAVLLYVIFKNNRLNAALLALAMLAVAVTLSDQFSSALCKPYFMRFRPTQDPDLYSLVSIVNGYRGGSYGFISSHAANCFAVATFVSLLIRNRIFTVVMFLWAVLPSYSRAYLGVHYPGDLLCGALAGILISVIVYIIYHRINNRFFPQARYTSNQYTASGYMVENLDRLYTAMLLTAFYVVVKAMILSHASYF